jgi:hypothetical protein
MVDYIGPLLEALLQLHELLLRSVYAIDISEVEVADLIE